MADMTPATQNPSLSAVIKQWQSTTTAFVADTLATNSNTAAKNSNVLSSIKEIAENIELIVIFGQEKVVKIANTVAQAALNLAENMNPMGVVIALIVALVAAIVILWNKNAAFRECITGMFQAIVALVQTIVASIRNFFAGLWNGIVGVFSQVGGWFANIFNGAWNNIRNAFSGIEGSFQGIWGSIVGIFSSIGTAVGNAVGGAFRNVVNSILGFAQNIINGFLNDINFAVGVLNHIPGVSIPRVPTLSLPRLATKDAPMSQICERRLWASFRRAVDIEMGATTFKGKVLSHPLVAEITAYYLRHTCCTHWFEAGIDIKTVQYLMGRKDIATTLNIHTHVIEKSIEKAANKIRGGQKQSGIICFSFKRAVYLLYTYRLRL